MGGGIVASIILRWIRCGAGDVSLFACTGNPFGCGVRYQLTCKKRYTLAGQHETNLHFAALAAQPARRFQKFGSGAV